MASEWIDWAGGECPVSPDIEVDVRFDDNVEVGGISAAFWKGDGTEADPDWWSGDREFGHNIIAYKVTTA